MKHVIFHLPCHALRPLLDTVDGDANPAPVSGSCFQRSQISRWSSALCYHFHENLRRGTLIACDCNWLHDGCQAISGWEHTPQNSCQTRHLAQSHQVSAPCSEQEWHFLCPPRLCSARQISWHNDSQKGLIWISFSWCKAKMQTWTALLAESWSQIPKEKRALLDLRPWRDHCGITDTAQPFLVQGCFKKAKIKVENQRTVSRSTWSNWH